jgi:hypothetical protein
MKTLNWTELETFIDEQKPVAVSAGLLCDWVWTSDVVWENGEWQKNSAYVTSKWDIPGFKATMQDGTTTVVQAYVELGQK